MKTTTDFYDDYNQIIMVITTWFQQNITRLYWLQPDSMKNTTKYTQ
jgi:mRNA-degrading endonuclease HigB of HigAB toxin-antitoxin module